jgi:hypothetical protein
VEVVPLRRILTLLLCLGACLSLLSLSVSGSEGSSTLGIANVLHVDQVANGYDPPLVGNNPLVPAMEAEETDKHPVNVAFPGNFFLRCEGQMDAHQRSGARSLVLLLGRHW